MVSEQVRNDMDNDRPWMVCVGIAIDSGIYYAALVDTRYRKNYVEEVSLSPSGAEFTGVFRQITDDKEWRIASDFFLKVGVFERFYNAQNWRWSRTDNKDDVPKWFNERLGLKG